MKKNKILAVYQNEIFKILKRRKVMIIVPLAAIIVALVYVIKNTVGSHGVNLTGETPTTLLTLSIFHYVFLPVCVTLISVDMFSGEYAERTIKSTLLVPVSRFKIFLSKFLAVVSFIFFMLMFIMVCSMVATILTTGSVFQSVDLFFKSIVQYIVSVLPMSIFALMVIMISNFVGSPTLAFVVTFFSFILLKSMEVLFPQFASFFYMSMFNLYDLFNAGFQNVYKIIRVVSILLGNGIVFFVVGCSLFESKEI